MHRLRRPYGERLMRRATQAVRVEDDRLPQAPGVFASHFHNRTARAEDAIGRN